MLDHEDLKWVAATSTDLNSMLQQISRYADLAKQHKGEYNYIELLGERVELASKAAQALFDRVTAAIMEGSGSARRPATKVNAPVPFAVLPTLEPSVAAFQKSASGSSTAATRRAEALAVAMEVAEAPPEFPMLNPEGPGELILIVEDETEVAEIAAAMLADVGYKVILAKDGFEALRIYQRLGRQIGLVILDFFLPVMEGDAVFDELRGLNPNIAVVLSSGFAEQSKLGAMLAQGLRGFIPKPYTREKLLDQVRSILDARRETLA
jgi:CheY-like chemotaxis protein